MNVINNQFVVFELNGNLNAIPLNNIIHFFSKNEIINGGFISFNNKVYFVENIFNIPNEKQKIVGLIKRKAIILPDIEIKTLEKTIPFNINYDFAKEGSKLILIHKEIL